MNSIYGKSYAILEGPVKEDFQRVETLSDIFYDTCARYPNNIALISGTRKYTYKEANKISDNIANNLSKLAIGCGDVVAIYLPRGSELLLAQLGVTKSGSAWLHFELDTPLERVSDCIKDSKAKIIITLESFLNQLESINEKCVTIESLFSELNTSILTKQSNDNIAYVIYTSGSTGTPKGIRISHKNICHFLRSENSVLNITSSDRVYQGFSCAFDMSLEEIWISYLVGATVCIASKQVVSDPDAITRFIKTESITVLHAVPTLLSLIIDPLLNLRLINVGGEACSQELASKLLNDSPNRKLFNTYGPTETTVSATIAELKINHPISIGGPLPNYGVLILNKNRKIALINEEGEIAITGPGLSPGYLNNDNLTKSKFISLSEPDLDFEKYIYLTGDLGKIDALGKVFCLGRVDNQIKLRGFRIELDEISSHILNTKLVNNAVVVLRKFTFSDELIAFVTTSDGSEVDKISLKTELSKILPHYMIPAHFEQLNTMPRLLSGKIDVNKLKTIDLKIEIKNETNLSENLNDEETFLFSCILKLLPNASFKGNLDFFSDLGGHSLLAARLVSLIRTDSRYASLSIGTIYKERRLGLIALAMKDLRTNKNTISDNIDLNSFNYKRIFCGIAQSLLLPIFITLNISDWLAPFFTYHYFTGDEGDSITKAISLSLLMFVFFRFLNFGIAIFGKRILTKPLKKGTYPLWGITYFNWWLATKFSELPDTYLITSTFWMRLYLRALGAKVGKDAIIDSVTFSAPELICIGDRVSIGNFANFENARVERGKLLVGPVLLEDDATVESYCVVEENTCIKKAGLLLGLSCLRSNQTINEGEVWEGTPANRTKNINKIVKQSTNSSKFIKVIVSLTLGLSSILASLLFFLPTFPAFLLIDWVDTFLLDIFSGSYGPLFTFGYIFILALPASALFVSATMLLAGCIRKALPKVTPQKFYIDSFKFLHKKFLTQIIDSSIRELHGLYASVFISIWLRLLGAKIGTNSEISNAEGFIPGLLEIGNDCFVADGASLGEEELNSGWITQNKTIINDRSFIGNSAYVAGGSEIPSDILIGVQTRTPSNEILKSGQTWLGSPAVLLPFRESSPIFPDELTFRPSTERYLARAFIESLRILTPVAFAIASGYTIVKLLLPIILKYGLSFKFILALSLSGCFYALLSFLLVLIIKWVLIGKYKSKSVPMWSTFVWFSEAVTSMYESLAVPNLLNLLRGTPLLPFFLRSLGVKIGKDVFINTTDFTEFDCVKIGDRSSLNNWSGPQTHLFEDRIMKIGTVNIGNHVSVGPRTIILYDTNVEDRVVLGSLSLVSKGENLPNDTEWTGSPAGAILAK